MTYKNKYAIAKDFGVGVMQFDGSYLGYQQLQVWAKPFTVDVAKNGHGNLILDIVSGEQKAAMRQGHYLVLYPCGGFGVFEADHFLELFELKN